MFSGLSSVHSRGLPCSHLPRPLHNSKLRSTRSFQSSMKPRPRNVLSWAAARARHQRHILSNASGKQTQAKRPPQPSTSSPNSSQALSSLIWRYVCFSSDALRNAQQLLADRRHTLPASIPLPTTHSSQPPPLVHQNLTSNLDNHTQSFFAIRIHSGAPRNPVGDRDDQ